MKGLILSGFPKGRVLHPARGGWEPNRPPQKRLLYSASLLLFVPSFLMISCFLDFTMAELLSVSLLKNAGGWALFPGDLEPILRGRGKRWSKACCHEQRGPCCLRS